MRHWRCRGKLISIHTSAHEPSSSEPSGQVREEFCAKALGVEVSAGHGDDLVARREAAAAALEAIGDERGREAIRPLLKDTDMVVKMRVERILAKWKKQPAAVS